MIHLIEVTEENWLEIANLQVSEEQKKFLAPPIGILARGYVYRNCNAHVFGIADDKQIVGMALVRDFLDEPVGYDLQQFMIDVHFQNRGYGTEALRKILEYLKEKARYDHVEVCVDQNDRHALYVYQKAGFVDTGYIDDDSPGCINLICYLKKGSKIS